MNTFEITDAHKEVIYGMSITQYKNLSKIRIPNGHELFKMRIDDGVVSKVTCVIEHNKVGIVPELGHIYVNALNLPNAHKKYANILQYVNSIVMTAKKTAEDLSKQVPFVLKGDGQIEADKPDTNTE